MKGEFIWVWSETWREIWLPLTEQEGISEDIYCELYRELELAIRRPVGEAAIELTITDSLQLREAFDRALTLAGITVDFTLRDAAFDALPSDESAARRRSSLEGALITFTYDEQQAKHLLSRALDELVADPKKRDEVWNRRIENIINDRSKCKEALQNLGLSDLKGERALVEFFEAAYTVLEDFGGDGLSNNYFGLLAAFIEKFSLRYDLRRPCQLCPTMPGVFASLVKDLKEATSHDAHLNGLMKDFEDAVRDLRTDRSDGRIRMCMSRQINLLEAMGSRCPGVTAKTIGAICNEVGTWPHESVKDAMKNLYKFTNEYPGIRHGGTPASAIRAIEMRDMVAMTILLAGFMPYLTDKLNPELVYRGA